MFGNLNIFLSKADKRHYLALFFILLIPFMFYRAGLFKMISKRVKVTISVQDGTITDLNTERRVKNSETIYVDELNFINGNHLEHVNYGALDYVNYFFMDVEAELNVRNAGSYKFDIGSDDGFELFIDGRTVCHYYQGRPLAWNSGTVYLTKGKHRLHIKYFQGYGNQGLIGKYSRSGSKDISFIGEDSSEIEFLKYK